MFLWLKANIVSYQPFKKTFHRFYTNALEQNKFLKHTEYKEKFCPCSGKISNLKGILDDVRCLLQDYL